MADYIKPVVFKLGEQFYGVDINLVTGIEKELSIVPVPNAVPYVRGIVNLRGEVIPVFSLKKKFSMDNSNQIGENMIIVKIGDINIALDVDDVEEISDIDPANIMNMPVVIKSEEVKYLDRVANINGRLIVLLDVEYILTEAERQAMEVMKSELEK